MKYTQFLLPVAAISLLTAASFTTATTGYQAGDTAVDFSLKNIDGQMISMASYPEAKGFIVTFTCNHCPYAVKYEQRIIDLDKKYKALGFPVIAINPNDSTVVALASSSEASVSSSPWPSRCSMSKKSA